MEEKGLHSAKLGSARRQGDKFPWEALGRDVKHAVFISYSADKSSKLSSPPTYLPAHGQKHSATHGSYHL